MSCEIGDLVDRGTWGAFVQQGDAGAVRWSAINVLQASYLFEDVRQRLLSGTADPRQGVPVVRHRQLLLAVDNGAERPGERQLLSKADLHLYDPSPANEEDQEDDHDEHDRDDEFLGPLGDGRLAAGHCNGQEALLQRHGDES